MEKNFGELFEHLLNLKSKKEELSNVDFKITNFRTEMNTKGDQIVGYSCYVETKSSYDSFELHNEFHQIYKQQDFLELFFIKYYLTPKGQLVGNGTPEDHEFVGVIASNITASDLTEEKEIKFSVAVTQ